MNTLIDVFRSLESRRGEFLVYDDGYRVRRHSYTDVTRAARGFAKRLAAAGLAKGDKVVLWGENRPEWVVAYWGAVISGIIVVPIDYRSSVEFADKVRTIVAARLVLIGDDAPEGFTPPVAGWPWRDAGDWASSTGPPTGRCPTVRHRPRRRGADRVHLRRHGGTQGRGDPPPEHPRQHGARGDRRSRSTRSTREPFLPMRFLNLLPLSHMFGQSMATNIPPLIDGTVVFMRSFNPHDIVRRVKEWRISVIVCVPKILDVLQASTRCAWTPRRRIRRRACRFPRAGGATGACTGCSA